MKKQPTVGQLFENITEIKRCPLPPGILYGFCPPSLLISNDCTTEQVDQAIMDFWKRIGLSKKEVS